MRSPVYIAGPTGAGKSAVAVALAEEIGGEIVNADAYQLYRGLDVLTAKPTAEELSRVPHHLYSIIDPGSDFDAARYEALARPCIDEILRRDRTPVVTGGSGLYLKTLTHGLSPVPPGDPNLRRELEKESLPSLADRLRAIDPVGAEQVNLLNRRYVIRAIEITLLSGRPMSEIKNEWDRAAPEFTGILLTRDREELYQRINERVTKMWRAGIIDEVQTALAAADGLSHTAFKAIGVGEIVDHLAGKSTLDECLDRIRQASRRYAKRQLTWFRREKGFQSVCLAADDGPESAIGKIHPLFPLVFPDTLL